MMGRAAVAGESRAAIAGEDRAVVAGEGRVAVSSEGRAAVSSDGEVERERSRKGAIASSGSRQQVGADRMQALGRERSRHPGSRHQLMARESDTRKVKAAEGLRLPERGTRTASVLGSR